MKLRLSLGVLAGALLMQTAGPSHARDLTRVWDVKQRCFRDAKAGECGGSYNVTTRTYVSAASQKAGAAADAQPRPTEAAPKQPAALLPSQALRELAEKAAAEEAAPKQDAAEKPAAAPATAAAETPAKAASTQDEWDVATPAKPKTERKAEAAAASAETKKPAKSAESTERPRGIRRTKADG